MPQYISVPDAAKLLGLSEWTVRKYIKTGALQAFRVSGSPTIRIKAEDLDALLLPVSGDQK